MVSEHIYCADSNPVVLGVFDFSVAPSLLFYAYIPIILISIFFGVFVLVKDRYSLRSKLLLSTSLIFAGLLLNEIVQWIAVPVKTVEFGWQLVPFFRILVAIVTIYFSQVFLTDRDLTFAGKIVLSCAYLVTLFVLPLQANIKFFDFNNCEGVPGYFWYVVHGFVAAAMIWIAVLGFRKYRSKNNSDDEKKQALYFTSGAILFLFIFFGATIYGDALQIYDVALVGPIGMVVFLGLLSYMIVRYHTFNAKLFASQVLVLALLCLLGALFFIQDITYIHIVELFTFGLVSILGSRLIRSVQREIEQREKIEKLAADLEKANAQLKDLDRQKDELISIVSHQLNTPVTSVKWNIEMMLDGDMGEVTEEQKRQLQTMQSVTTDLADLVAMMLDVSRIQLGRMKVDRAEVDLSAFFKEIMLIIDPKAEMKKQKIVKNIPATLPVAMLDKRLLRMTLENLLTNAVKYTPEGGTVTLTVEAKDGKLRYAVRDTGYGIPKAEQGKIFGKLFRASNVNAIEGNGLGLFAAKGAVEAQGGAIRFESEEGKGTTFFVELPLTAPAEGKKEGK